jgi:hypothetical protein
MRCSRTFRSRIASSLVALLGALATGLPSHQHEGSSNHADQHHSIAADLHSHGTLLVDQEDRVQSAPPELAVATELTLEVPVRAVRVVIPAHRDFLSARERAPPPGAPRAPPPSV